MPPVPLTNGPIEVVGALDLEQTPTGVVPRRLPAWTRPQIPDLFMDVVVQMPSGVRLRFSTDSTSIELDVMLTLIRQAPRDLAPAPFDLVVNGELVAQTSTIEGNVITVGRGVDDVTFDLGGPTTIRFDGLAPTTKVVELWLPQASGVELRALRIDDDATAAAAPPSATRRWIHHGSSISHCLEASSPIHTWPAVAARLGGVELLNLGFGGNCMLDPFVARTIRDQPADVISLKLGINVVNADALRERAFVPAVHGFLDTIRDGHADTPILLASPIFCPSVEDHPGPTVAGPDGRFRAIEGMEEMRATCLSLARIRTLLAQIVEQRRALGDDNLHHLDGLQLFGADDAADLHDDLHPNAAGYVRIGERFAAHAFAPGGPLSAS